jgi:Leucine-rich repeat (LRR) protein
MRFFIKSIYLVILYSCLVFALFAQVPQEERQALIALYHATGGEQWASEWNWLGPPGTESQWLGVGVEGGHVTQLNLASNFLQGALPPEIGTLTRLRSLILTGQGMVPMLKNEITGLPDEIGNCTSLELLCLSHNLLTELPASIGNLTSLRALYLSGNQITELPASIGQLSSLRELLLSENQVSVLPDTIGSLKSLTRLMLSNNRLSDLPPGIGGLESLEQLHLLGNQLSHLPVQLTELSNLQYLILSGNQLQSLPPEVADLKNLELLSLSNNRLSSLGEGIGGLAKLRTLDLDGNELRFLPVGMRLLTRLKFLTLTGNPLASFPQVVVDLEDLTYLELGKTGLTDLPETIGNIGSLWKLALEGNAITHLPEGIGNLSNLGWLDLTGNRLAKLPDGIGGLTRLKYLYLSDNRLEGAIPEFLGGLQELLELSLSKNRLTGSIPVSVMQLPKLKVFLVDSNQLEGALPGTVGPSLFIFNAANNDLTGTLPSVYRFFDLNLSNNRLSGPIPFEVPLNGRIVRLNLSGNQFSGRLPGGFLAALLRPETDLRWNAIEPGDALVDELVDSVLGREVALTQTQAPEHVQVKGAGPDAVELKWKPIPFQEEEGGYEILHGSFPEGPFALLATTAGKGVSSMTVTGVDKNDYFAIRTFTEAHENNRNRVVSHPSNPVSLLTSRDLLSMYFPSAPLPGSDFLGVAVTNFSSDDRSVQVEGFGETGTSLPLNSNPALLSLKPGAHLAQLSREILGGDAVSAWLEMTGGETEVGALFQMGSHTHMDGAVPFSEVLRHFLFTHILQGDNTFGDASASTVLNVINPGNSGARVSLRLFQKAPDQEAAAEVTRTERLLLPKAAFSESVVEIFGARSFGNTHVEVEVIEGEGVVGFQWIYIGAGKALAGLPARPVEPTVRLFAPQVAMSGQLTTLLKLINTNATTNTLTISLRVEGSFQSETVSLPAGGVLESSLEELLGPSEDLKVGTLEISASELGVIGNVIIGSRDGAFASAAPLQRRPFTEAVFSHVARNDEWFTGLALVFPEFHPYAAATVHLRVYSSSGVLLGEGTVGLQPRGRVSRLIHELVPDLPSTLEGYLVLDSDAPVIAQQFYGDYAGTFVSLVPPTIVRGLAPR